MPTVAPYVMTNDSIVVHFADGAVTINADHLNFGEAWDFLASLRGRPVSGTEELKKLKELVSLRTAIQTWSNNEFNISKEGVVSFRGERLPSDLHDRIYGMFRDGKESWTYLANFWIRLSRNPSRQSVLQLFKFLSNKGIPIGPDGYFYCYKGVNADYKDNWSKTFDNRPGNSHWIPRNKVSDDSSQNCAVGFHAGNMSYAKPYGQRLVIVRIDPANVARVQDDGRGEKIGVSAYSSVGDATSIQLPSGTWNPGNDQYCKNYKTPEDVYGSYGVWLTAVPDEDKERITTAMAGLGFPGIVTRALLMNLPVCVQGEVDAETAKATFQALTPKDMIGTVGVSVAEVRGMPLDLLNRAPESSSPTPAMFEVDEPDRDVLPVAPKPTERKMRATVTPLLDAKTGVDAGHYKVSAPETGPEGPPIDDMNRAQLRVVAKKLGIPKYSKPGAAALRQLIREVWLEQANERKVELEGAVRLINVEKEKERRAAEPELQAGDTVQVIDQVMARPDLSKMNKEALRAAARGAGIPRYSSYKLDDLRDLIRKVWEERDAQASKSEGTYKVKAVGTLETSEPPKKSVGESLKDSLKGAVPLTNSMGTKTGRTTAPPPIDQMSRAELRKAAGVYKVPFTSKLGPAHLRKLIKGVLSGQLDMGEMRAAKRNVADLRILLDTVT
jgi:hypothetical protein